MPQQPDALKVLRDDHRKVEDLFARFEKAGDRAYKTKRRIVDQMIRELSVHAAIEEEAFYPAVRERMQQSEDEVLESLEEHHLVKLTLAELDRMEPTDERFDAKVMVMMESVRHHAKEEEEGELFPKVR
jgi:hemerythrin superfamily protein